MSTGGVFLFSFLLPVETSEATLEVRQQAFRMVILGAVAIVALLGILSWWVLPNTKESTLSSSTTEEWKGVRTLLQLPQVWLLAIIIVCAYVGYKVTDDFSLFAREVLDFNEINSAYIGTMTMWVRPIVAILTGILADRLRPSRLILWGFLLLSIVGGSIGTGVIPLTWEYTYLLLLLLGAMGVYALRSIYFSVMEEAKIPLAFTGAAVGLMSVIGYTPDIFMGPLMGYYLDHYPEEKGHQYVFLILMGFSIVGLIATFLLKRIKTP
ncbi:hypothetical protein GCM10023331_03080 [Algivirga pacifica]|uniref:Major facilitator superfamily (MFS) profile domain-containing protein n=2 Tax=Algivirga pacifica TaxID=1162670 RepID=A0ABP9CZ70_9BACT